MFDLLESCLLLVVGITFLSVFTLVNGYDVIYLLVKKRYSFVLITSILGFLVSLGGVIYALREYNDRCENE